MSDMFVASLQNRVRAMNELWQRAVSDMTLDHVNHQERRGVLPIAFSLSHFIRAQDQSMSIVFRREQPLWDAEGWAEKVGVTVDLLGREESVEEMEGIRFADFEAWKAFQTEVIARTKGALDTATSELLAEVVMPQIPSHMQQTFCGMVIGLDTPLRRLDVIECWVYQHGLRHMGEIEHGRALVGLGGMTN
jgi:hypothetical protein